MSKIGNGSIVSACTQRVNALKKHLGAKDEVFVGGKQVKASDLVLVFQDALDSRAAAVTAKGEYKSALAVRDEAEAKRLTFDAALQLYVLQRFGATSTEAHDFGYAPKKVTEKTAVTKAKAAFLNQATRDARGTKSAKEKQKIKGTLSPEASAALEALAGSANAATPAPSNGRAGGSAPVAAGTPAAANGAAVNGAAHS